MWRLAAAIVAVLGLAAAGLALAQDVPAQPGNFTRVAVAGGPAFVQDGNLIRIARVDDPAHPIQASAISLSGLPMCGEPEFAGARDGFAYVLCDRVLDVIRATDPSSPTAYSWGGWSYPQAWAVADGRMWVGASYGGSNETYVSVASLADPAHPTVAPSTALYLCDAGRCWFGTIAATGGYAAVLTQEPSGNGFAWRLRVVDATDPAQPRVIHNSTPPVNGTMDVAADGRHVYVANSSRLVVLDVSDPSVSREVGDVYLSPISVNAVVADGTRAYVGGSWGFEIVDVSDPAHPSLLGAYAPPGYAVADVAVQGDFAYLAAGRDGLRIVDVSDPTAPREVGVFRPPRLFLPLVPQRG